MKEGAVEPEVVRVVKFCWFDNRAYELSPTMKEGMEEIKRGRERHTHTERSSRHARDSLIHIRARALARVFFLFRVVEYVCAASYHIDTEEKGKKKTISISFHTSVSSSRSSRSTH